MRLIVKLDRPGGMELIQAQMAVPSSNSTSQAWQEPIKQPVGI